MRPAVGSVPPSGPKLANAMFANGVSPQQSSLFPANPTTSAPSGLAAAAAQQQSPNRQHPTAPLPNAFGSPLVGGPASASGRPVFAAAPRRVGAADGNVNGLTNGAASPASAVAYGAPASVSGVVRPNAAQPGQPARPQWPQVPSSAATSAWPPIPPRPPLPGFNPPSLQQPPGPPMTGSAGVFRPPLPPAMPVHPNATHQHAQPPSATGPVAPAGIRPPVPGMPPMPPPSVANGPQMPALNSNTQQMPQQSQMPTQMQNTPHMQQLQTQMAAMGLPPPPEPSSANRPIDLLRERNVLAAGHLSPPSPKVPEIVENPYAVIDPNVFRSTIAAVPNSNDLLKKSRLPLALVLQPFRDMKSLNVIQTSNIVRCRQCRTYINPYVVITDARHWKCNICYRTNDLPDEFNWDPVTKSYGHPSRRPEIKHATVEFIAPSEYMPVRRNLHGQNELRPPQAAQYIFVLDVSAAAADAGYLATFCQVLKSKLDALPGDERTSVGFVLVDSAVHFFEFADPKTPPRELVVVDVEDVFQPNCRSLVVSLDDYREAIELFLDELPSLYERNCDAKSALGAAVNAAYELIADNGGRITVVQCALPDVGPGALSSREDPNLRASKDVANLGPAHDFYKGLALNCSGHQVSVDLFLLNSRYADLATLSEMSKFCAGNVYHFSGLHIQRNAGELKRFEHALTRYLGRRIGFEAVLRIRCTRGLALRQFYGNFFVRATDLLALPNVNPDSAIAAQIEYEEALTDVSCASFQAALLYTSSKGDRRIRVHTLCLPVTSKLSEVLDSVDARAMVSLLGKLAAERTLASSALGDARDAVVNAAVDALAAYAHSLPVHAATAGGGAMGGKMLLAPQTNLRLVPLLALALLKSRALCAGGQSVKLDERVAALNRLRTEPTELLIRELHPSLYALHALADASSSGDADTEREINVREMIPAALPLSAEHIERSGVYLMDTGSHYYVYVCAGVSPKLCSDMFGAERFEMIDDEKLGFPVVDTLVNERARRLLVELDCERPYPAVTRIIREDGPARELFVQRLVADRTESSHSYVEFLQYIQREVPPPRR